MTMITPSPKTKDKLTYRAALTLPEAPAVLSMESFTLAPFKGNNNYTELHSVPECKYKEHFTI